MKEKGKLLILGLIRPLSGSDHHRVKIPMNALHGQKITINNEEVTIECKFVEKPLHEFMYSEEDIKNNDIIWNVHVISNIPSYVELFCQKYNTLWIQDIDDSLDIPENHINRKSFPAEIIAMSKKCLIQQIVASDLVLTTNNILMNDIVNFCSLVGVSENYLPI